mmetsp:Transcript_45513/g.140637  ORF Transcript_45513/g.140637 Transcript_45513/m.140637 type:complete len:790 (-) Transcript_45513:111-2480(-)
MAEYGVIRPAPKPVKNRENTSTGWKDITLKIFGTGEKITLPVMVSSKVWDVKCLLAEMHGGGVDPLKLELVFKYGPSYKRHRNGDEIQSSVLVKGMKSFVKGVLEYPFPYLVIGAGSMGLRQAMHYSRRKVPYVLMDRMEALGGNAWLGIANATSKLQTEGPQYQLQYDVYDGNFHGLMPIEKYGYWPSTAEILAHMRETCDSYGVTPHIRLCTEVTEMEIHDPGPGKDFVLKRYDFHWKHTKREDEGVVKISNLCYYPGCLVVPHRKTWPGEDVFGGQIGYGFSHEFDYRKLPGQDAVIIGMGAFAHENVRTFVEFGGNKVYNVCRHFNLMMPRVVCWWVNQSSCPPTAAMVLHAMKPMYDLIGMNPWNFFSVTANAERTVATIKQYTRWGISDIYFLAIYFDKLETVQAEVKRFKPRAAVLNNGRIIEDLDHVIKVLGFDSDFGVDRVMKAKVHLGFWPDGDHRRWVCSDQSAIDASRFGGTAIAPYAAACTYWPHHFFKYPLDAKRILAMGIISENKAKPELGSAAYHYEPRIAATVQVTYGSVIPEIAEFSAHNDGFKKGSMWCVAPVHRFLYECERDWMRYCEKFKEFGDDRPFPPYPYDLQFMYDLLKSEAEDGMQMAARQGAMRQSDIDAQLFGIDQQHAHAVATGQEDIDRRKAADWFRREAKYKPAEEWAAPAEMPPKPEGHELTLKQILSYYNPQKPAEDGEIRPMPIQSSSQPENSAIAPGSEQSWLPARQVLKCRASSPDYGRSPSPASRKLQEEWLSGANMLRDAILQQAKLEGAK